MWDLSANFFGSTTVLWMLVKTLNLALSGCRGRSRIARDVAVLIAGCHGLKEVGDFLLHGESVVDVVPAERYPRRTRRSMSTASSASMAA